jgi:hypothetical protein
MDRGLQCFILIIPDGCFILLQILRSALGAPYHWLFRLPIGTLLSSILACINAIFSIRPSLGLLLDCLLAVLKPATLKTDAVRSSET